MNILERQQGTEILPGASAYWGETIDGSLERVGGQVSSLVAGEEATFKFRGSAATFDAFAIFVPSELGTHPKEIELFAGDDAAGPLRSLGVIVIANGKLRDGWQEFKLPETTAKFFKVKLLSHHATNLITKRVHLYELRLHGEIK